MPTCPNCGSIVMEGDPYCTHCGTTFQWSDDDEEIEKKAKGNRERGFMLLPILPL